MQMLQKQVEEAVLREYPDMYRLAYSYVKNRSDAMDIVQDSALKAMTRYRCAENEEKVHSWLMTITVHTALDFLRKHSRETAAEDLPETGSADCYRDTDLDRALQLLDDREREIVILRYFEDLKIAEVAAAVNLNENTVKSMLYRALHKMKVQLGEGEQGDD